eukprot:50146_1
MGLKISKTKQKSAINQTCEGIWVIGNNEEFQFGLAFQSSLGRSIYVLGNWSDSNKHMILNECQIISARNCTILTDCHDKHWICGDITNGECDACITAASSIGPVRSTFFDTNNIQISKICANVCGKAVFWISNKDKVYINGGNKYNKFDCSTHQIHDMNIPQLITIDNAPYNRIIDMQSAFDYSLVLCTISSDTVLKISASWYQSSHIPNDIIVMITIFIKTNQVYSTEYCEYGGNGQGALNNELFVPGQRVKWRRIDTFKDKNITKIRCGNFHSLFVECRDNDTMLWSCGSNICGQLGLGTMHKINYIMPPQIISSVRCVIIEVECGMYHNLMIDANGVIYSWGQNNEGQCGHHQDAISYPKVIPSITDCVIKHIKCGSYHSYCMNDKQQHFLFGSNTFNECTLKDQYKNSISQPFCINTIVQKLTNGGMIENVYLGFRNTIIITS